MLYVLLAGGIQATMDIMDATATGYDLIITPTDSRGNVGTSRILTVLITGRCLRCIFYSFRSFEFLSLVYLQVQHISVCAY